MDAEDLLYDLTEALTDEFDSLIIFRDAVYDRGFQGKTYILPKMFRERINSITDTQEKRILESLIHYSRALGEYYNYLDLNKEYRQMRFYDVDDEIKQIENKLNYIEGELNNGKRWLNPLEDHISIDFFDSCISTVRYDLKKVKSNRRGVLADKLHYQLDDARLNSDLKSDIINELKKIIGNKLDNNNSKSILASDTIRILLQDSRVNGNIVSDILDANSIDQRKKIIEKEIKIRKAACKRDKIILNLFNKFRWITYLCLLFAFILTSLIPFLLFLIFGGINYLYSEFTKFIPLSGANFAYLIVCFISLWFINFWIVNIGVPFIARCEAKVCLKE